MANQPPLTSPAMRRSLTQSLIPVADKLRGLLVQFGQRPYNISIIRTKWSGGERGVGAEILISQTYLDPTPRITDLTGVNEIASPAGLAEQGSILLSRISGSMTEEALRGLDPAGNSIPQDEQFFYEIEFPHPQNGSPSTRRRFTYSSAPYFDAPGLQWRVELVKQRDDREYNGDLQGP